MTGCWYRKFVKLAASGLLLFVCVVVLSAGSAFIVGDVAYAAAVSWDGGGAVDDWCTDANWSNDAEPTIADDVTIDAAVTVTTSGCVTEVHTLNFSTLVVGGTAAATLEIQANIGTGGSITIGNLGTVTQKNATTQTITGTLTVNSGGTLNHTDNTTEASASPSYAVKISAATITINSGGSINVDGKGNTAGGLRANGNGTAPGLGSTADDASGAGHGGDGGNSDDPFAGGTAYCDVTGPATIGSGGGSGGSGGSLGGDGGGLVVLNATGTVTVSGTITADGANGATQYTNDGGGGAGGGVKITADTIAGTPAGFTVTGGNAGGTGGGGGGGGCVYLGYSATGSNSIAATAITMNGGTTGNQLGGAGIVYIKQTGTSGDLFLTNGGTAGAASTQNLSSLTVATITLKSEAEYRIASGKTLILNSAGNDPLSTGDGTGVLRIDDGGTFTPNSTFSITGATLELHQSATFNNASILTIGTNGTLDMRDFTASLALSKTTVTVNSGGIITHGDNTTEASTAPSHVVNISATTITVNSGGSVNVDGKGNTAGGLRANGNGTAPGLGSTSNDASGAGHGGDGGNSGDPLAGGTAYCSVTGPATIGSGGGSGGSGDSLGGDGGGLIVLNATGTITINGTITADGVNGATQYTDDGGGGAGGGVKITADTIAGTPTSFTVTGGNAGGTGGGGGGGGCVYLGYSATGSNSIAATAITMNGGTTGNQLGGAGIVYIKQTGTSGDLFLTNGGTAGAASTQNLSSLTVATLTLKSEAEYRVSSGKTFILNGVGNDPLSGGDGTGVLRIDDSGTFTPNATFSITGATLEKHQSATMNNASTLTIGTNGTLDMRDYTASLAMSTTILTVNSGGTITHGDNTTEASNAPSHVVNISATTITVNSGGSINVDGKGNTGGIYRAVGNGTGGGIYGSSDDGAGGAHGGNGGNDAQGDAGGTAYCTSTNPATIGSGGAGGYTISGGDGAGLVKFNASGVLTIAGTISANGANGASSGSTWGGGGAGGGVNLTGDSVVFSGTINTIGGNSSSGAGVGGGGGGGCIYIAYTSSYNSTGSTNSVAGGTGTNSGASGAFTTAQLNQAPTVVINSAAQKTSGTGTVDLSVTADDADDNNTLKAKVEYKAGTDCSSGISDPTLDETDANTTSTYGDPKVENDDEYHVGNASGWITTSSGANTVLFDWLAETDLPTANGTYCVKITPHDGISAGTAQTTTLTLDNVNPTSAGNLTLNAAAATSLTFSLGAAGSDTNINQYKVYYKAGASGVSESDTLNATVASGSYVLGNLAQITELSVNTQYVANIWTYDSYGNKANATEIAKYTAANVPSAPTVTTASITSLTVVINQNSNPSNTTYAIKVGSQYVQVDGTLGASEVWQTYTVWGGATGQNVTGLSVNTQYAVSVKARNGDGTETGLSSETSKYTYANPASGLTASTNTSTGTTVSWSANGNPAATVYNVTGTSGSTAVSGDVTGTSWTDSSANRTDIYYCYSLTAKNGDSVDTAAISISGTSCGYQGGGGAVIFVGGGGGGKDKGGKPGVGDNKKDVKEIVKDVTETGAKDVIEDGSDKVEGVEKAAEEIIENGAEMKRVDSDELDRLERIDKLAERRRIKKKVMQEAEDLKETGRVEAKEDFAEVVEEKVDLDERRVRPDLISEVADIVDKLVENKPVGDVVGIGERLIAFGYLEGLSEYAVRERAVRIEEAEKERIERQKKLIGWVTERAEERIALDERLKARPSLIGEVSDIVDRLPEVGSVGDVIDIGEKFIASGYVQNPDRQVAFNNQIAGELVGELVGEFAGELAGGDVGVGEKLISSMDQIVYEVVEESVEVVVDGSDDESADDFVIGSAGFPEGQADVSANWVEEVILEPSLSDTVSGIISDDSDADGDGVSNVEEVSKGTNPYIVDSDWDGIPDSVEDKVVVDENFDLAADSDGDKLPDVLEEMIGTEAENVVEEGEPAKEEAADVNKFVFGSADAIEGDNPPILKVGTFDSMVAISSGGTVVSGTYKPNKKVKILAFTADGSLIGSVTGKTDMKGKLIKPFPSLDSYVGEVVVFELRVDGKKSNSVITKVNDYQVMKPSDLEFSGAVVLEEGEGKVKNGLMIVMLINSALEKLVESVESGGVVTWLKLIHDSLTAKLNIKLVKGKTIPNSPVVFSFSSLTVVSVVIADGNGDFELQLPDLEKDHEYIAYTVDYRRNTVSPWVKGILRFSKVN